MALQEPDDVPVAAKMWWLVSSLAPAPEVSCEADSVTKVNNLVGQHPTSDVILAGEGSASRTENLVMAWSYTPRTGVDHS